MKTNFISSQCSPPAVAKPSSLDEQTIDFLFRVYAFSWFTVERTAGRLNIEQGWLFQMRPREINLGLHGLIEPFINRFSFFV